MASGKEIGEYLLKLTSFALTLVPARRYEWGRTTAVKKLFISVTVGIGLVIASMARAGGPKPIHSEYVQQVTSAGTSAFGPVGPNCDATAGGTGCAFVTGDFTVVSQNVPLGPSTGKGTNTILFGLNGVFATASGVHDDSGRPTGFCAPEFSTETDTYGDGSTISQNFAGTTCSVCINCPANAPFGPPATDHFTSEITEATGKFAGATGGFSGSVAESGSGGTSLSHFEGVLQRSSR
jgi:hypothetical protein